ncbi:hypothetical protein [Kitasatospora purpeofusca]|uniref:hypothetical protein n=1 Tax=Kitasatospora purpeofusca TaxID=67352 RepID=UPI0004BF6B14|nr:hypothetical protein [Kitasatospora purpeofusca]
MTALPRATRLHRPVGRRPDRGPADHLTARRCDCGVCRALARRCRWLVRRVGGSAAGRRRARASVAP